MKLLYSSNTRYQARTSTSATKCYAIFLKNKNQKSKKKAKNTKTHLDARGDQEPRTGRRARAPLPRYPKISLSAAPRWGRRTDVAAPETLSPETAAVGRYKLRFKISRQRLRITRATTDQHMHVFGRQSMCAAE